MSRLYRFLRRAYRTLARRMNSRFWRRAGSALMLLGGIVLAAVVLAPERAPVIVEVRATPPPTPTPAYLSTPLPPPRPPATPAVILPVMPVFGEARGESLAAGDQRPAASETSTLTMTPTDTPSPTATPAATLTMTVTPTASPTGTHTPPPSTVPSLTPTATRTPTSAPTRTPSPAPTSPPPIPQRIAIPRLRLSAPVAPVSWRTVTVDGLTVGQWDVPDGYAAGWHEDSARLGAVGNTVLNGHHNIAGSVFGDLIDLVPGDAVLLFGGGQSFHYTVAQILTLPEQGQTAAVRLENARWILPSQDERVTLVTCWPPSGSSHRLIVIAVPSRPGGYQAPTSH